MMFFGPLLTTSRLSQLLYEIISIYLHKTTSFLASNVIDCVIFERHILLSHFLDCCLLVSVDCFIEETFNPICLETSSTNFSTIVQSAKSIPGLQSTYKKTLGLTHLCCG